MIIIETLTKLALLQAWILCVGLLGVRLKYNLYVCHLSKWLVFVNSFMFLLVCF